MADFRKWILALVAVGLLLGIGSSTANAQGINCSVSSGVPATLRAEGITELTGDLVLSCTSPAGTPGATIGGTPGGVAIPQYNVQISINTNLTSRIVGTGNISEALLMIDEPYPGNPPVPANPQATLPTTNPVVQRGCLANNNTNCAILSQGSGGIGATGNYNGGVGHPNMFQGVQNGVNSIAWTGVPIDPPGSNGTRVIRITNIRANAFQLGVSSTLIPTQINETITVSPPQNITINQPAGGTAVGQVFPGLLQPPSVKVGLIPGAAAYQQCNSVNTFLLTPPGLITTDNGISVSATEGFAASFKPQNFAQMFPVAGGTYTAPGTFIAQNVPGFAYPTESGFVPALTVPGLIQPVSGTEAIGFADTGTEVSFTVNGVGAGISLFAPSYIYLTGSYGVGTPVGVAVLQGQAAAIGGAFGGGGGGGGIPVAVAGATGLPSLPNGPASAISVSGTTATIVYQIWYANPSVQESMSVPISVAYISNTGSNIPATTTTPATVGLQFYPQSTVTTASTGPVPRFGPSGSPVNLFSISPCSCNLLFPFVTNIAGFDTGVAIANTSSDPFGTSPQTGTVTLNYYGTTPGGGAAPPKATTTSNVPGGQELIFTLSNGGNFGIPATPGFEGYLIAQANFQYCHGFAFISDVGAQKLAEGYLAIELDVPGLQRVGIATNIGENKAH